MFQNQCLCNVYRIGSPDASHKHFFQWTESPNLVKLWSKPRGCCENRTPPPLGRTWSLRKLSERLFEFFEHSWSLGGWEARISYRVMNILCIDYGSNLNAKFRLIGLWLRESLTGNSSLLSRLSLESGDRLLFSELYDTKLNHILVPTYSRKYEYR